MEHLEVQADAAWKDMEAALSTLDSSGARGGRSISNPFKSITKKIRRAFEKLGDQIKSAIRKVGREAEEEIKDVAQSTLREVKDEIEDLAEAALTKVTAAIGGEGLDIAVDLIETTAPDSLTLKLGIDIGVLALGVAITVPDPVARLDRIKHWANHPPKGRHKIILCIEDFGPESITIDGTILGNGASAGWSGPDKMAKLDRFLSKRGIG